MEWGLALPQYDFSVAGESPLTWETVEACVARAETVGFGSVWVSDHLSFSIEKYGGPAAEYDLFSSVVAMGAIAATHPALTVGCLVFCAPLRPPRLLAKQLQTVTAIGAHKVIAGMGAGWYERDFEAAGLAFPSPAERLRQLTDALIEMRDFDPHVPRWVGGRGDRLIDVAVQHADGWNTVWAWTPDAYTERLDVVRSACDKHDRDPAQFALSLGLGTLVGENERDVARRFERLQQRTPRGVVDRVSLDDWRVGRLVGTVDQVREMVADYEALGVSMMVANLGALPFSVTDLDDLDLVASVFR